MPLESYVNFSCIALGERPSWFINGEIVDDISESDFIADGFRFLHSRSGSGYNHTLTMSVLASLQSNNTVIICRVYGTGSVCLNTHEALQGAPQDWEAEWFSGLSSVNLISFPFPIDK